MENTQDHPINPSPPIAPFENTQNISWLKTLSIGFSLVSFGIAIGIIGYFLTLKNQSAQQKEQVLISPTNSPSPTIDSTTANWKTYDASKFISKYGSVYNFSFKYPSAWTINEQEIGDRVIIWSNLPPEDQHEQMHIDLTKNTTLDNEFNQLLKNNGKAKNVSIYINTLGNVDGIEYEGIVGTADGYGKLFMINNTAYSIEFETLDLNPKKYSPILDQILSTFKFTN